MTAAAVTSDLMTEVVTFPGVSSRPSKAQRESARTRFPPRPVVTDWPTTHQERAEVWERLTSGMFVLDNANSQERRVRGLAWLLDWLADQPGETWQQRWMASGADAAGGAWRRVPIAWQQARGRESRWLWHELSVGADGARLENGVTVEPGAVVGPRAEIGSATLIGAGAVIGPDSRWTLEIQTPVGAVIDVTRSMPAAINTVMQLH